MSARSRLDIPVKAVEPIKGGCGAARLRGPRSIRKQEDTTQQKGGHNHVETFGFFFHAPDATLPSRRLSVRDPAHVPFRHFSPYLYPSRVHEVDHDLGGRRLRHRRLRLPDDPDPGHRPLPGAHPGDQPGIGVDRRDREYPGQGRDDRRLRDRDLLPDQLGLRPDRGRAAGAPGRQEDPAGRLPLPDRLRLQRVRGLAPGALGLYPAGHRHGETPPELHREDDRSGRSRLPEHFPAVQLPPGHHPRLSRSRSSWP